MNVFSYLYFFLSPSTGPKTHGLTLMIVKPVMSGRAAVQSTHRGVNNLSTEWLGCFEKRITFWFLSAYNSDVNEVFNSISWYMLDILRFRFLENYCLTLITYKTVINNWTFEGDTFWAERECLLIHGSLFQNFFSKGKSKSWRTILPVYSA